ncbi:MAG: hypothetical protein DME89_06830 [Verrucomicrobia bacterium]|nr:MAG: hypothetical protein DME89_06830 [Verrucomicrobiota bacterium]PYL70735.1 MAG: hypothetical protein DMF26_21140 [Verrucomicrobiota bacterium]
MNIIARWQLVCIWSAVISCGVALYAQEETQQRVVVSAESEEAEHDQFTELGEYAQPAWAERSRFSSTTSVYVLSPYEMFVGNIWEAIFRRHGKTLHDLTQEVDFGLPHRFEVGVENELGLVGSDAHETSVTAEARYAFANWNAIPLNPAISAEYIFGVGKSVKDTESDKDLRRQPNAVAVRLLLGQNFGDHFGYGLNVGLQQDVSRDSGREFEISQSVAYGAMKGKLEFGAEMRYVHNTLQRNPIDRDELVTGPTIGWKPTRQLRISLAPLFGCTGDSPRVASFVLVSYEFGGAEAVVTPISGNR